MNKETKSKVQTIKAWIPGLALASGWLAVVVSAASVWLTYQQIEASNEREVVMSIWNDSFDLQMHLLRQQPSEEQKMVERDYLLRMNANVGLLDDPELVRALESLYLAWDKHRNENQLDRSSIESVDDAMETVKSVFVSSLCLLSRTQIVHEMLSNRLGSEYSGVQWHYNESPGCDDTVNAGVPVDTFPVGTK